jgi:hypothetical protein
MTAQIASKIFQSNTLKGKIWETTESGEEEGECDADLTSFLVPRFRGPEVRFAPHLPSIGFENLQPLHDLRSRELLSVFEIEIGLSRAKIYS